MSTFMPVDERQNAIPVLRMRPGLAHSISFSDTSARNATAFHAETKVISLYATEDVFLRFGDGTVTAAATDHFFPRGTYYDVSLGDAANGHATHVAVIRASTNGTLYISEKD